MATRFRPVVPHTPHHISLAGQSRRPFFHTHGSSLAWLDRAQQATQASGCHINALSLLPGAAQLVVTPSSWDGLVQFMGAVRPQPDATDALPFYRCTPLTQEVAVGRALAAVDLACEEANLCLAVNHQFSSYGLHVGRRDCRLAQLWTPSPWYLALAKGPVLRARRYADWAMEQRQMALSSQGHPGHDFAHGYGL